MDAEMAEIVEKVKQECRDAVAPAVLPAFEMRMVGIAHEAYARGDGETKIIDLVRGWIDTLAPDERKAVAS